MERERERTIERGNHHRRYRENGRMRRGAGPLLDPFLYVMLREDEEKEEKFLYGHRHLHVITNITGKIILTCRKIRNSFSNQLPQNPLLISSAASIKHEYIS
jgi:hypothetical protein